MDASNQKSAELLVSVIVPVFNGEEYLAEAIDSILSQTYRTIEIIVVDDGSTDRSDGIVRSYGKKVSYFRQGNAGTGSARNHGIRKASGELLAFLDQDDRWMPGKLLEQIAIFREKPEVAAVFGMVQQFISPECDDAFRASVRCPKEPAIGYIPSAMLIRREAFHEVGAFGEDWQLGEWADWFARFKHAGLLSEIPSSIVAWRRLHPGNKGLVLKENRAEYARIAHAALKKSRGALRGSDKSPTA